MIKKITRTRSTPTEPIASNRDKIIDAAIRCFQRYGITKTYAEDVAKEAGLARATVYRAIPKRQELIEAVSYKRMGELAIRVKKAANAGACLEDALVKGGMAAIKGFRDDPVVMMMVESTGDRGGIEQFMLDPKSPVVALMLYAFSEAFQNARTRDELRDALTDGELATWLCSAYFLLILSDKLTPTEQRSYIRKFIYPSVAKRIS